MEGRQEGAAGDRRVPGNGPEGRLSTGDQSGEERASQEGISIDESKFRIKS